MATLDNMSTGPFLLSGLGCMALALFLVHSPLLILDLTGPLYDAVARDGLSAFLLLVIAALMRIPARPGAAFGSLAALSLVPVLSFAIAALLPMHPAVAVFGGSGLGLLMIPVFRERGIKSLVVISVMVSLALTLARRQSLLLAEEARQIQVLGAMIEEGGMSRHFLSVDEDYPIMRRRSLALRLWHEDPSRRIDLISVGDGSEAEADLLASGWRGLRIGADGYQILEPETQEQHIGIVLQRAELGPAGPVVEAEGLLEGSHVLDVLTPCGSLQQIYDHPGVVLQLSPRLQAEYRRLVAGLPAGMPVLLRLVAGFGSARSAWIMLRIP